MNGLKHVEYANYYKFEYFVHGDDWKKNVQSEVRDLADVKYAKMERKNNRNLIYKKYFFIKNKKIND